MRAELLRPVSATLEQVRRGEPSTAPPTVPSDRATRTNELSTMRDSEEARSPTEEVGIEIADVSRATWFAATELAVAP